MGERITNLRSSKGDPGRLEAEIRDVIMAMFHRRDLAHTNPEVFAVKMATTKVAMIYEGALKRYRDDGKFRGSVESATGVIMKMVQEYGAI